MFRRIPACRSHHFFKAGELHENAELSAGIGGEFAGVHKDLVPSDELCRKVREKPFFDVLILARPIDKPKDALAADDLQDESQQPVRQRLIRDSDIAETEVALEQANQEAVGAHALLDI